MKKVIEKNKRYGIIKMIGEKKSEMEENRKKKGNGEIKNYFYIIIGTMLCGLGINLFYVPQNLVSGGISGVALIVYRIFGIPMGLFMIILNVPIFIIGVKVIGGKFGVKSLVGTFLLSLFIDICEGIAPITENLMLCALFGGVTVGISMGIVFLAGASSGGTDVLAKLGNKLIPVIDVGKWLFLIDIIIILSGGITFGNYELMLYGVVALFVTSYMIDFILAGADFAKVVYIISPKADEIAKRVIFELKRGVTGIYSKGMYKQNDTLMLMCIVKKFEFTRLKQIAKSIDSNAFIILTQAREVAGEGFKKYPEE